MIELKDNGDFQGDAEFHVMLKFSILLPELLRNLLYEIYVPKV